jgi:hypothetical protein
MKYYVDLSADDVADELWQAYTAGTLEGASEAPVR